MIILALTRPQELPILVRFFKGKKKFPPGEAKEGESMNHGGAMWADARKPVIRDQIFEMSSQHALNHPHIC